MELEKTTVLSALVWVAGVLAEVVFHESLSNSVLGLVLSIIVAAIVIAATYFIIDGVNSVLIKQRKETEDRQHEYQERMFRMLDDKLEEQINIERSVYDSIGEMIVVNRDFADRITAMPISMDNKMPVDDIVETINANTLQAAKIIAKYQIKNSESINEVLDEIKSEVIKIGELDSASAGSKNGELVQASRELTETWRELLENNKELLDSSNAILENNKELLDSSNALLENNKELLDNSSGLLENNKELLDNSSGLLETNKEILGNSGELLETNKELLDSNRSILSNSNKFLEEGSELIRESREFFSDNKQFNEESRGFYSANKELIEGNKQLLENNKRQLDNSNEVLAANKELMERLSRIENIIKDIEPAKVEEIKAYIDSVIEEVNTQMMKKVFTAQRTAVNNAAARTSGTAAKAAGGTAEINRMSGRTRTQVKPDAMESGIARIAKVSGGSTV